MRTLLLLFVAASLGLAGCISGPDDAVTAAADAPIDVADPPTTEPLELTSAKFTLGPLANTPLSSNEFWLDAIEIPEGMHHVVVQIAVADGASVDFSVTGIEGCELTIAGPAQLAGMERSPECAPPAGTYDLVVKHTSGHVTGSITVLGTMG